MVVPEAETVGAIDQVFWLDEHGPVAAVLLTCWADLRWQADPIRVSGVSEPGADLLWTVLVQQVLAHARGDLEVPLAQVETALRRFAEESGLTADDGYGVAWMELHNRPPISPAPTGFVVSGRNHADGTRHPMTHRNGDAVEERLNACSLYDPHLDLAAWTSDGRPAGYTLFWNDPITGVGLVEPVRVEDEFARRGLARAMLTEGLDRLAHLGTRRAKVGFGSVEAETLYRSLGFVPQPNDTWYEGPVDLLR